MTAPKDKTLRDRCEEAASEAIADADADQYCGDIKAAIAHAVERVAKAERVRFAELAIWRYYKAEHGDDFLDGNDVAAAIAAAEKGDGE